MKVAIVGAGVSGLSCAQELVKNGVNPTIYEQKSYIGDHLEYTTVNLKMFNRFVGNPMRYLKRNYGIKAAPIDQLTKIVMYGPSSKTTINGKFGYVFIKGPDERSVENQIVKNINLNIKFSNYIDPLNIKDDYDYVVVATGKCTTAKHLGVFHHTYNGHNRIATVIGSFNPGTIKMWLNTDYTKQGYSYLLPYNNKKAYLVLSVSNITHNNLDYYWNKFLTGENIDYLITETRDIEHNLGLVYPVRVDNMFLVGNSGGCIDSFLGFGGISAVESGAMAARAIINGNDYNKDIMPIYKDMKLKHEYRRYINRLDNNGFDRLVTFLGLPVVKQFIYKNPFYKSTQTARLIKLYNDFIANT